MKKRIACLLLALVSLLAVCSCSCIISDTKYDYDMTEYIRLPDYLSQVYEIEEDALKLAIGTYLLQCSSEYTVKRGDKIQVDIRFYDLLDPEVDAKGEEITELFMDDLWIENVATPNADSEYAVSYQIENGILGSKIGATVSKQFTLADDFAVEEYRGKKLFVDVTVNNKTCEAGDVVLASYTGYYLDNNGDILKVDGKEQTFDSTDSYSFFIGSHLAIEDFEQGFIGLGVGEEKDVYATFPEDYSNNKDLAGEKVLFKVKIKSFYTPPTYNDDFVQTYFSTFKTTAEFEAALKENLTLTLVYDYINNNAQIYEYPSAEYKATNAQLEEIADIWYEQYSMTLDAYIQSQYGMTRDAYIKSNMKTEMIFYSLRNIIGADAEPTEAELASEKEALISEYKNDYMTNDGLTESQAIVKANEYVEALGENYIYEQVMYGKLDKIIPTLVKTTVIESEKDYIFDAKTK